MKYHQQSEYSTAAYFYHRAPDDYLHLGKPARRYRIPLTSVLWYLIHINHILPLKSQFAKQSRYTLK